MIIINEESLVWLKLVDIPLNSYFINENYELCKIFGFRHHGAFHTIRNAYYVPKEGALFAPVKEIKAYVALKI